MPIEKSVSITFVFSGGEAGKTHTGLCDNRGIRIFSSLSYFVAGSYECPVAGEMPGSVNRQLASVFMSVELFCRSGRPLSVT